MNDTMIYALDFDGVICDSAIETAITGWKVARILWPDMPVEPPADLLDLFKQVRPVMETGYEAILIIRLLYMGVEPQALLTNFSVSIIAIIENEQLDVRQLKKLFGETRDAWIKNNLKEWIDMNPLFEGIANKLSQIDTEACYIITTKQERFVSQILTANNISFPPEQIFGLDRNLSKQQILADLLIKHPSQTILFVEDRLPTLVNVIDDRRLQTIALFFADWGYNTVDDKRQAKELPTVTTIDLNKMQALLT